MTHEISASGLTLIRKHEGFRAKPTPLPDGTWLVGYNHVRKRGPGAPMTQAQARERLAADLVAFERLVNKRVTADLTQSQFDALVSFAFSIGADAFLASDALRHVNAGAFLAAAGAMEAWRMGEVGGETVVVDALVRRRAAECALLLKDVPIEPTPSALLRPALDHAAHVTGHKIAGSGELSPSRAIGLRLTQILRAEPATAALLLTQAAPVDDDNDSDGEITTAHAKPVARPVQELLEAKAPPAKPDRRRFPWLKRVSALGNSVSPLMLLGVLLMGLGAALLFEGEGGLIDAVGAASLMAPGAAAMLTAVFGSRQTQTSMR
jgi:lysozyme